MNRANIWSGQTSAVMHADSWSLELLRNSYQEEEEHALDL